MTQNARPPLSWNRTSEESHILALDMLTFLGEQEHGLERFLGNSGLDLSTLRNLLTAPETLAAIMDFMLQNEDLLAPFCQSQNLSAEQLWRLRRQLPGAPLDI